MSDGAISHTETYRVPFGDTDAAGVVFYPNYYRWFDRMTHSLFRAHGLPLVDFTHVGQAPVLIETGCRFFTSTHYDDLLELRASIIEVRTKGFRVEHLVSRDSQPIAEGFESRVWVDMSGTSVKAMPLPDSVRFMLAGQNGENNV